MLVIFDLRCELTPPLALREEKIIKTAGYTKSSYTAERQRIERAIKSIAFEPA